MQLGSTLANMFLHLWDNKEKKITETIYRQQHVEAVFSLMREQPWGGLGLVLTSQRL